MTDAHSLDTAAAGPSQPASAVFFLSDSTGVTAETLGNSLLTQFPDHRFQRHTVPFIASVEEAENVVQDINTVALTDKRPIIFSTVVNPAIRALLSRSNGHFIDLLGSHTAQLEDALQTTASPEPGRAHGLGDAIRYQSRIAAVEYAIEHDDGQSIRALDRAELILIAPSRCGKTPTMMYLALQHGVLAANFPLIDEDFTSQTLPEPLRPFVSKCFGLTFLPARLSQIRQERRPGSNYASLSQCSWELRNAQDLYAMHGIPYVNSASMSVEEISATILQRMNLSS
ncbi:pyruvate, water dikinase regulatory protein [Enteractinococcus helveticum]|uniref:Putative phosphoenolpyruvate synthase regulatory protein n=1 Tax=Enteractinococcus helveticum TaxID=1837282 RepID=A0A1B7M1Y8_9MICC|nr:pyruvate, water dikinase regulatory protein [Enteractinococcus helveticum]OAV62591.1 phosphoenolpyruvate synthase regulatory protein [Enteractinococcus helveticum]